MVRFQIKTSRCAQHIIGLNRRLKQYLQLQDVGKNLLAIRLESDASHSYPKQSTQDLLDELEAARASRKRAWENLQENSLEEPGNKSPR